MGNEIDTAMDSATSAIKEALSSPSLSPGERRFVASAGAKLAEDAFSILATLPEEERLRLRPFVMIRAIASIMGIEG
jgi:hypothetical protein